MIGGNMALKLEWVEELLALLLSSHHRAAPESTDSQRSNHPVERRATTSFSTVSLKFAPRAPSQRTAFHPFPPVHRGRGDRLKRHRAKGRAGRNSVKWHCRSPPTGAEVEGSAARSRLCLPRM